jgi:hypothetical protein
MSISKKMMEFKKIESAFLERKNHNDITLIRQVLYDFNYTNLSTNSAYITGEISEIRKGILNFIYFGNFEGDSNNLNAILDEAIKNDCIDEISKRKKKLNNKKYENKKFKTEKNDVNNEIVSYENQIKSVFNFETSFYINFASIADGIIDKHKDFVNNLTKIDYILVYEAPPFKNKDCDSYFSNNYFLTSDKGNYASSIKNCFSNPKLNCEDILKANNTAYFDLFMAGMPIGNVEVENKSLRECWCTDPKWEIGGKALPVVLFELGIFHLLKEKSSVIIKFPKIAIGAPIKTSVSILEYYNEKPLKIFVEKADNPLTLENVFFNPDSIDLNMYKEILSIDVAQANNPSTFKNIDSKGILVPLHKANIVSSANSPHGELMKNAFDILTTHNSTPKP